MKFYTNVQVHGSKIHYIGIEDSKKVIRKINYKPTLYIKNNSNNIESVYKSLHGEKLGSLDFESIYEAKDYCNRYKDVVGHEIFGNRKYEYSYISDMFPENIEWSIKDINIAIIDIEVASENGFPNPEIASEEVTAITIRTRNKFIVFGCGNFDNNNDNVIYIKCDNEKDLLNKFLKEWTNDYPDVITGWNVKQFDIPYLINRIQNLFGDAKVRLISPWNVIYKKENISKIGKSYKSYSILGISILDYMDVYLKYAPDGKSRDSYKLDNIAFVELGERKLSYDEHDSLHQLYQNDYQKFIEYNIRDVELIQKLEDKLKLIELILVLAYDSKTNYEDAFAQTRMWDVLIYNFLRKKNIIIPDIKKNSKDSAYIGAYVKEPIQGFHKWIASFDLTSLYPHLIMQFNISPDTIVEPEDFSDDLKKELNKCDITIDTLLNKEIDTSFLKNNNVTITPNGQIFTRNNQGFLPVMMEEMFKDRDVYKKQAISAKKELELEKNKTKRKELENKISRYDNLQLAKKVCLNSAYGALGNEFFRFFDTRQASAITTAGQLIIRWIEKKLNEYLNKILKTENMDYVIASDTDSIYLNLHELVNQTIGKRDSVTKSEIISFMDKICEDKIQPYIDKSYGELAEYTNAFAQKMKMKREVLADSGIWTAKKHYILNVWNNEGVEYEKPKMKIMGLEIKKSSTPSFFRTKMEKCIELILTSTESELKEYIETVRDEMNSVNISEIAFPRGINGIEKFYDAKLIYGKGTPIHVRGSLIYNHLLKKLRLTKKYYSIKEGEKIKFIYLKEPNIIGSNIISFLNQLPSEFELEKYIDYDTQFKKAFIEPIKIITDAIGMNISNNATLESFLFG